MLWLAVALGGAAGASTRYALGILIPLRPGEFPLATFSVNVAGSFLIGVLYVLVLEKSVLAPWLKELLIVGLLGALTTWSSFSLESINLMRDGYVQLALGYLFATIICCLLATLVGLSLTSRII